MGMLDTTVRPTGAGPGESARDGPREAGCSVLAARRRRWHDGEGLRSGESGSGERGDDRVSHRVGPVRWDQGDRGAAEATASHPGAEGAVRLSRLAGEIQFRAGDFEVVA